MKGNKTERNRLLPGFLCYLHQLFIGDGKTLDPNKVFMKCFELS